MNLKYVWNKTRIGFKWSLYSLSYSSDIVRRPQNLRKNFFFLWTYLVPSKFFVDFFPIFLAFSEYLNFNTIPLNLMGFKNFKDRRQTHKLLFHIIDQVNS